MEDKIIFDNQKLYKNRELSWLQFEERVLNEAKDSENLLFERLKFLSITASNLDEFFMIRVATLKRMEKAGYKGKDIAGMTPGMQIEKVSDAVHKFVKEQYRVYESLLPLIKAIGVEIAETYEDLEDSERIKADKYFDANIFPILTPLMIDATRPFPLLRNDFLYLGGFLKKSGSVTKELALIQIPKGIERLIRVSDKRFILLEEIVKFKFNKMFTGFEALSINYFRVLRNADLVLEPDEDVIDILTKMEEEVGKRENADAIRLELSGPHSEDFERRIKSELGITETEVYELNGPIDLTFLSEVYALKGFEKLKKPPFEPVMPWEFETKKSLFEQIKEHDLMLIHPFESFKPVIDFITEAAKDKNVLAIKQTLYRVSGDSPIVKALMEAARNGKQVTVLVELKARFDEENNINWARMLEKAGCHVIYGFAHIKTHCKITLVIRRENGKIKRYVHLGTGNYNDSTAKQYTDVGFFTAREEFGEDATNVFNLLSGYSQNSDWKKLYLAPMDLRHKFIGLIEREAEHAAAGRPSHIIAKLNSLCDKEIIDALYIASGKGVKIDLIVRGICCLRVGIKGVSDNITVRSIVGNFLEHSRVYYFKNGGDPEYYCSSADWMPRNMDKRIEILFPVERKRLREKLNHVLKLMLKDNKKAWILQGNGEYVKKPEDEDLYSFQDGFIEEEKNTLV